jgi:hypothetical protein
LQAPFVEAVTADPIAINGINLAAVEARRRFRVHFTMWEADRTGDVAGDRRIAARPALRSTNKSHASVWKRSVSSIAVAVSLGSGAPNSVRYGYAACGMDSRAPVRPPLRPLSTGFRHRFLGIRHRFLSAVSGDQSGGFARFATRLNPLTPCFVTGKTFLRIRLALRRRHRSLADRCPRHWRRALHFVARVYTRPPVFVTGKNFPRMRPGAVAAPGGRQRFDPPSPRA